MMTHGLKVGTKGSGWVITLLFIVLLGLGFSPSPLAAADKWPGVDEVVMEKFAREHGREAVAPLLNTDQGNLLLFLFLLSGAIAGFVAGYYWRTLTTPGFKAGNKVNR